MLTRRRERCGEAASILHTDFFRVPDQDNQASDFGTSSVREAAGLSMHL